ncbi:MAG: hypothetical protein HYT94_01420 [Parcubacteria group bacterium]|nr:hypothetical protein [Parcubacteria group bacterium]
MKTIFNVISFFVFLISLGFGAAHDVRAIECRGLYQCVSDTSKCAGEPVGSTCADPSKPVCCVPAGPGPGPASGSSGLVPCGYQEVAPGGDATVAAEDCDFWDLIQLAKNIIDFLLYTIAMPLAAIMFAYAGWLYLSAAGNESKVKEAHNIFGMVAMGLALALAAWLIINAIVVGLGVGAKFNPLTGGEFGK